MLISLKRLCHEKNFLICYSKDVLGYIVLKSYDKSGLYKTSSDPNLPKPTQAHLNQAKLSQIATQTEPNSPKLSQIEPNRAKYPSKLTQTGPK